MNTDALSYHKKFLDKCPQMAEIDKKRKYLEAFLKQRHNFSSFFVSVDGILVMEAEETLKSTASHLNTNWKQTYSRMYGYVKSRMAITMVQATHFYIQGSWEPVWKIILQRPQW